MQGDLSEGGVTTLRDHYKYMCRIFFTKYPSVPYQLLLKDLDKTLVRKEVIQDKIAMAFMWLFNYFARFVTRFSNGREAAVPQVVDGRCINS